MPEHWYHPLAVCHECHILFHVTHIRYTEQASIHIRGNSVTGCPKCGIPSPILNAIYTAARGKGHAALLQSGSEHLQRLIEFLKQAAQRDASREDIARELKRIPEFSSWTQYLPKDKAKLKKAIAFFITLASILVGKNSLSSQDKTSSPPKATEINKQIIEQSTQQGYSQYVNQGQIINIYTDRKRIRRNSFYGHNHNTQSRSEPLAAKMPLANKRIGPNQKCDCGSGRKYKNCHGRTPAGGN